MNIAIKGHSTRGKEVIETLEMLGGENKYYTACSRLNCIYFINDDNGIEPLRYSQVDINEFEIFTLEEFLEKYPYKVGDKVRSRNTVNHEIYIIKSMEWDDSTGQIYYTIKKVDGVVCQFKWAAQELRPYKSQETMEEKNAITEIAIEYYFEEGSKDKVLRVPNNQEIVIENGIYILRDKKPKYPKTYEECCEVLNLGEDGKLYTKGYKSALIQSIQKLFICRDAYWKIVGEEMGLDKTWEPDWGDEEWSDMYYISFDGKNINKETGFPCCNMILIFPIKEMRDIFYENFKDLIEQCKELL